MYYKIDNDFRENKYETGFIILQGKIIFLRLNKILKFLIALFFHAYIYIYI